MSARDIDLQQGTRKFNGDTKQFINMLVTFDKLTLDDCLTKIYVSIQNEKQNLIPTAKEIQNLEQSAQTVEANGLSFECNDFLNDLIKLQDIQDAQFHSLVLLDKFINKVLEFKDEIKKLSQKQDMNNIIIAKQIQNNIQQTVLSINYQQNKLSQSRQQISKHENSNRYVDQQNLISQNQTVDQQNQNYTYFTNINRQKNYLQNQGVNNFQSPNMIQQNNSPSQYVQSIPDYPGQSWELNQLNLQPYQNQNVQYNNNTQIENIQYRQNENCECTIF